MFKVTVQPDLQEHWQSIIERQVDIALSPLRASLKSARVCFGVNRNRDEQDVYWCKVNGCGMAGESYHTLAKHTDGVIAVVDATARARREIARHRQRPIALR